MHFSAGTGIVVPNQLGLPGTPSTQLLTRENFDPCQSIMNPCTITPPLHLGHESPPYSCPNLRKIKVEEVVIRGIYYFTANICIKAIYYKYIQFLVKKN
jgi:hypothetical protein